MTTEEDFRRALADNPADFTLRLVYADWLEEQGDVRAMGMRALGLNRLRPSLKRWYDERDQLTTFPTERLVTYSDIPHDWFVHLADHLEGTNCRLYASDDDANDAAAVAFAKLPPERREELLRVPVLV